MLGAQQGWVCVRGSERLPGPGAAPGSAAWVWAGRELQQRGSHEDTRLWVDVLRAVSWDGTGRVGSVLPKRAAQ